MNTLDLKNSREIPDITWHYLHMTWHITWNIQRDRLSAQPHIIWEPRPLVPSVLALALAHDLGVQPDFSPGTGDTK